MRLTESKLEEEILRAHSSPRIEGFLQRVSNSFPSHFSPSFLREFLSSGVLFSSKTGWRAGENQKTISGRRLSGQEFGKYWDRIKEREGPSQSEGSNQRGCVLSLAEIFVGKFKSSQTVKILTKKCSLFLFCIFPKITGLYFPFLVFPRSLHSVLNLEEMHEDDKAFIASQSPHSLCVYFRSRKRGRK